MRFRPLPAILAAVALAGAAAAPVAGLNGQAHAQGATAEILIEAAFVVPESADAATAYLVINNRSGDDVTLSRVASAQATEAILLSPRGQPLVSGATIPPHAELYMTEGGVSIALRGLAAPLVPGAALVLDLTLSNGLAAAIPATVIATAADLPDHHDYPH